MQVDQLKNMILINTNITNGVQKRINLGRNSVSIEKCGERVTAPMKRTTLGCLSLNMISTCMRQPRGIVFSNKKKINSIKYLAYSKTTIYNVS